MATSVKSVDWTKTKVYALGLSGIYLNLEGAREPGIVKPDEAESLKSSIAQGLSGSASMPPPARWPSDTSSRVSTCITVPSWRKHSTFS